jgi:carbamoyl-phosphate synthase large subunit
MHFPTVPSPMLQRPVALPSRDLGQEMTCSLFHLSDNSHLGPFTARRTLRGGNSWYVECREFPELHALMNDIAGKTKGMGSLNVQLMVGKNGPVPFEINARFSGTTAIRAHFGFNEPEMCLRHFFLGQTLPDPEIKFGVAIRYLEEVFIDGVNAENIGPPFPQGTINPWF